MKEDKEGQHLKNLKLIDKIKKMRKGIAGSGVKLPTPKRCMPVGKRMMESRDENIEVDLDIDPVPYKGNANLLAQR